MLDTLRPRLQVLHDVLDFQARSHHDRHDPHRLFSLHISGGESVDSELRRTAGMLQRVSRRWCETVVAEGNHDRHLKRWLREGDYRHDPLNAITFLELQLELYRAMARGEDLHLLEHAMRERACPERVRFLRTDESLVVVRERAGGIELGLHGDLGPNGQRGSPLGLARMGRRACIGHSHSACIVDGLFVAGTSSQLDMGYNSGPSSWSHSHVVVYPSGARAVVTMWRGRWRAAGSQEGDLAAKGEA
jgi:hypothetical protein